MNFSALYTLASNCVGQARSKDPNLQNSLKPALKPALFQAYSLRYGSTSF